MFQKGVSGNPAGRPPGALNKNTRKQLSRRDQFLDEEYEQFRDAFRRASARVQCEIYAKIQEGALPKLQDVPVVDWEGVTDDALDQALLILQQTEDDERNTEPGRED